MLPIELTIRMEDDGDFILQLDATRHRIHLGQQVSKSRLLLHANTLLVEHWRHNQKIRLRPMKIQDNGDIS